MRAVTQWGMEWRDLSSYLDSDERVSVLKPHGSIHWEHRVPGRGYTDVAEAERVVVHEVDAASIAPTFDLVEGKPWNRGKEVFPAVPVLALPMADKTNFAWPPEQHAFMESLNGRVTSVLAIGWRAAESHFRTLLHDAMKPDCTVAVVTPNKAEGDSIGSRIRPKASAMAMAPLVIDTKFSRLTRDARWRNFLNDLALRCH
jgi:hypothetical protein